MRRSLIRAFGQAALVLSVCAAACGDGAKGNGPASGAASANGAPASGAASVSNGVAVSASASAAPVAVTAPWNDPVRLGPPARPLDGERVRLQGDASFGPKRDRVALVRPASLQPVQTFGSLAPGSIADDAGKPTVRLLASVRDTKTWYRTALRPLTSAELAGVASTESIYVTGVVWSEQKEATLGASKLAALVWYGEGEGNGKVRVRLCKVIAKVDDATEIFATASWVVGDAAKEDLALALLANMVPIAP